MLLAAHCKQAVLPCCDACGLKVAQLLQTCSSGSTSAIEDCVWETYVGFDQWDMRAVGWADEHHLYEQHPLACSHHRGAWEVVLVSCSMRHSQKPIVVGQPQGVSLTAL